MQILGLMETYSMFSTYASFFGCNSFEQKRVLEMLVFFERNVHVEIPIANMPVSKYSAFCNILKLLNHIDPLLDIEGNIV